MKIERKEIARFTLPSAALKAAFKYTDGTRAPKDTNPALSGVCLELTKDGELTAVTTNRCALAYYPLTADIDTADDFYGIRLVLPAGSPDLKDIKGPVTFRVSAENDRMYSNPAVAILSEEKGEVAVPLLTSSFPNWRTVLQKSFLNVFHIGEDMRLAFRHAWEAREKGFNDFADVALTFKDGQVEIRGTQYINQFCRVIPANDLDNMPEEFSIVFRLRYVRDILKPFRKGSITSCHVNGSTDPVEFSAEGVKIIYLPVRPR